MLTQAEIDRLAAEEPQPREGESAQEFATRYGIWYGEAFGYQYARNTKGRTDVPVITVHHKKVA